MCCYPDKTLSKSVRKKVYSHNVNTKQARVCAGGVPIQEQWQNRIQASFRRGFYSSHHTLTSPGGLPPTIGQLARSTVPKCELIYTPWVHLFVVAQVSTMYSVKRGGSLAAAAQLHRKHGNSVRPRLCWKRGRYRIVLTTSEMSRSVS